MNRTAVVFSERTWHAAYLGAIGIALTVLTLFPVWRGQSYLDRNSPAGEKSAAAPEWIRWGSFGLQGVWKETNQAPVWDPPDGVVRWPWQPVSQRSHVEIELWLVTFLFGGAVIACGILLRWAYRLTGRKPDRFVHIAWSTAASLALAELVLLFVSVMTLGATLEHESWLAAGVVVAGLAGIGYGIATQDADDSAANWKERWNPIWQFTIGVVLAFAIWSLTVKLADNFRGPIVGRHELFGAPRYARDQTPVNVAIGLITASGALGIAVKAWSKYRSLAVSVALAGTILGVLSLFD